MDEAACPRCQLPRDADAWHCDGCGHIFDGDLQLVHARLSATYARSATTLLATIGIGVVIATIVVLLATRGFIYVSVPVGAGVVGSIGHAAHRRKVLREQLSTLERANSSPVASARARDSTSRTHPADAP